jgi:hypothetical protein
MHSHAYVINLSLGNQLSQLVGKLIWIQWHLPLSQQGSPKYPQKSHNANREGQCRQIYICLHIAAPAR